jgi:hypothetical protein
MNILLLLVLVVISKAGIGLAILFGFSLVGYAISCDSSDSNRSITFTIEHYNTSGVKTSGVDEVVTVGSLYVFTSTVNNSYSAGSMCVKVSSVSNLSDIDARYIIALFFQISVELG